MKCTGEYTAGQWPKTHETMRCASGKVAAPAADETETLKQSFAEWKKFRPVREFPSSEEQGQVCGKFRAREGGGDTAPHTSSHIHRFHSRLPPLPEKSLVSTRFVTSVQKAQTCKKGPRNILDANILCLKLCMRLDIHRPTT